MPKRNSVSHVANVTSSEDNMNPDALVEMVLRWWPGITLAAVADYIDSVHPGLFTEEEVADSYRRVRAAWIALDDEDRYPVRLTRTRN